MTKKEIGETSYKQTAFGILPRAKLIPMEIEGIKRAWDFVLRESKLKKITLNSEFIQEMHRVGFAWIFPEFGGKFRTIEVKVSRHSPPKFHLIPQLVVDFSRDLITRLNFLPKISNDKFLDELTSFIAWAHHRFLWIHPFTDYNGRIGRLLNSAIMLKLNLPPIELKVDTPLGRKKYVNALQEADLGNYHNLEKIVRSAIVESIVEIDLLTQ